MTEPGYQVLDLETLHDAATRARRQFESDVLIGLTESPKRLSSKYFYDDRGSELFQRITELEEYYPTNCEFDVLRKHKGAIADAMGGEPFNLVDLGAGDGRKTEVLLEYFTARGLDFRYVPIDISEGAMRGLVAKIRDRHPKVRMAGLVSEYFDGLAWLAGQVEGGGEAAAGSPAPPRRNLVLFLGSNIGNFDRAHARGMLRRLWNAAGHGDVTLIGFDLKKDIDVLLAAYNDREGVTAEFNLNLLRRINRELDADFDLTKFRHFSTYSVFSGAMESYLVSLEAQQVHVGALSTSFAFKSWEPIHTEYSYKYLVSDTDQLAESTGFALQAHLYDSKRYFLDALWRVEK